jgi:gentisate 1,2-dioxygenase
MIPQPTVEAVELERLYDDLESDSLQPLWLVQGKPEPPSPVQPHVWLWEMLQRHLQRAGRLLRFEDSEVRRALILVNPGLPGRRAATTTLMTAVQMIKPGETVLTHRHNNSAIRFITHGHGAFTTVQGEELTMSEGDLLLTPNWTWHDHTNSGDQTVIWMDGLDRPLVKLLDSVFFELFPGGGRQTVQRPAGHALSQAGAGSLRPLADRNGTTFSPQYAYRWQDTYATLQHLAALGEASPFDDVAADYRNPTTGGHVLPTLGCVVQLLRPGAHTRAHRHTSSAVYHVFRGHGYSVIDGQRFDWSEGDYLALPPWTWHEHGCSSPSEPAILFSITDVPVFEALALYREEPYEAHGGYQPEA